MSAHPTTRDLDLWLIDKDAEGVIKPGPGVVYDRAGIGIVFMDERGRDFTFIDVGTALEAWAGQGARLSPALARDLALALERFADYADGHTAALRGLRRRAHGLRPDRGRRPLTLPPPSHNARHVTSTPCRALPCPSPQRQLLPVPRAQPRQFGSHQRRVTAGQIAQFPRALP